jgi:hypothetical protein
MHRRFVSVSVAAVLGSTVGAHASLLTLIPSKDNTLYEDGVGAVSNGIGEYIFVGRINQSGGLRRRAVMAFDLTSLPAGASINTASMNLRLSKVSFSAAMNITLHKLTSDWGEGDSNGGEPGGLGTLSTSGDATWVHRFYNTSSWANSGGDYVSAASGTFTVEGEDFYTVPITGQLLADVTGWASSPATNFGWILIGDETNTGNARRFDSSENLITENCPRLLIDYTPDPSVLVVNADTNYDTPAAWSAGVPNAPGAHALFGAGITESRTITLDTARTLGALTFDSLHSYNISGAGSFTLDGDGGGAYVNVNSGSHSVAVPLQLNSNTTVSVAAAGSTLALTGDVGGASIVRFSKTGPGTLEIKHIRTGALSVNGGSIKVIGNGGDSGTSRVTSLFIGIDQALDLRDNDLVIDYNGDSPLNDVLAMIGDGRLTSSAASLTRGLGYGESSATGHTTFSGQSVDATSVLVKYTYFGDSDLDGDVDVADLGTLASNWQTVKLWTGGDFDYNGSVDVADLGMLASNWQAGVGNPLGPSVHEALSSLGLPSASVPEPMAGMLMLGLTFLARAPRRRKRLR